MGPKGKGGKKKKPEKIEPPNYPVDDWNGEGLPPGLVSVYLTVGTQEQLKLVPDVDVSQIEPKKLVPKEDFLKDMKEKGPVSDIYLHRSGITYYPDDEILVYYDADFTFGENFAICLTELARDWMMSYAVEEEEEDEEEDFPQYWVPLPSVPWQSHGSDLEIQEGQVVNSRQQLCLTVSRKRGSFGQKQLQLKNSVTDYIGFPCVLSSNFSVFRKEMEAGVQAVKVVEEKWTQTLLRHPRNRWTEYSPEMLSEEDLQQALDSSNLSDFLKSVCPSVEWALQQNEIMDVASNDLERLQEAWGQDEMEGQGRSRSSTSTHGTSGSSGAEINLTEFQSLTDLMRSKGKQISCVRWHPSFRGVLAFSCLENITFEQRTESLSRIQLSPPSIIVWNIQDPIHPQIILQAPDEVACFDFCPSSPYQLVAGGCVNGQIVLWDLGDMADRLRSNTVHPKDYRKPPSWLTPLKKEISQHEPMVIEQAASSSLEHCHKRCVTDLQWLPHFMQIGKGNRIYECDLLKCTQLATCSADGVVAVWDLRYGQPGFKEKTPGGGTDLAATLAAFATAKQLPKSVAFQGKSEHQHLDLCWKPLHKMYFVSEKCKRDMVLTKFNFHEQHGKPPKPKDSEHLLAGGREGGKHLLEDAQPLIYVGSEEGEVALANWLDKSDSIKVGAVNLIYWNDVHDGPVRSVSRSPFFLDMVCTVGGATLALWKESLDQPVLLTAGQLHHPTCATWSLTRPAVFFAGRKDGSVEAWDLLERADEAILVQQISGACITDIQMYAATNKHFFLSMADAAGTLHLYLLPRYLWRAQHDEMHAMTKFLDREMKRQQYVNMREAATAKTSKEEPTRQKSPLIKLTIQDEEDQMKERYRVLMEEEDKLLLQMGVEKGSNIPVDIEGWEG